MHQHHCRLPRLHRLRLGHAHRLQDRGLELGQEWAPAVGGRLGWKQGEEQLQERKELKEGVCYMS